MKGKKWIGWGLPLLLLAGTAGGQVMAADDGVYHLGEVVVSGAEQGVEKVGTTHIVTAAQIEERGARTLDQALYLVPGVQVRVGGDGTPRIDIRGFRTRHVRLLLNGTPFNASYDGQFDPALISVENIAEIRVTTGGGSTLYGPGGNAGVINIITKKATKGLGGSIGGELGEGNMHLFRGTAGYGSDKFDVFLSGSTFEQDYFLLSHKFSTTADQPDRERRNSDRRRHNLFANVGYSPSDATLLGVTLSYMQGERGKPPFTIFGNADPYAQQRQRFEREDDAENFSAQLAFSHDFTGPLSVKGWGYFNSLDVLESNYDNFNYNTLALNRAYRYDHQSEISGFNLQGRYDAERYGAATLGFMLENNDYRVKGFEVSGNNNVRTDVNGNWDFQLYSVNLEYEVSPLPKLGVVLGVGHHWQDRSEKTTDDTSYLVGLTYQLFEPTRLKFSHSRKVRFPTLRDLYDPQRGNPDLKPEVTWHFEGGVEQQLPGRTLFSVTGFYAEAEDFIERPEGFDIVINNDKYEFTGVEVAVENTYFDGLWMRASYDYLDTEDASPGSTRPILQNRPRHSATLEASYRLPWWGLSTYGSARWVANTYYNARTGNLPQRRYPEYLLVDWRINKAAAGGALDLYFGINNLLDANYEQSYGLPQAGRMIYGGVNWKF